MSTISPSLKVTSISVGASSLRISVLVLPELFVSTISVARGASGITTFGTFKRGTSAKQPGSVDATVSSEHYDYIITQKNNGAKLAIELEYTSKSLIEVFVEVI